MRKFVIVFILTFFGASFLLNAVESLKRVDQWKHDLMFRRFYIGVVDKDDQLISMLGRFPLALASKEKIVYFAPRGQGKDDLELVCTFFNFGDDVAFLERPEKIKIFTKKDGTYVWKETKWLKRGPASHTPFRGVFFDNKIFLTGVYKPISEKKEYAFSLVRVYDINGQPLKDLIERRYDTFNTIRQMIFHIVPYKNDRLFFLPSDELKVSLISSKSLEIVKEIPLQIPSFYKKMPENFYIDKNYGDPKYNLRRDIEEYEVGYSRITQCGIDKNYIVVQLRTCSAKLKKFALLFYNAETFKLENTIYTDDFLIALKDGKYYFFENGEPGLDENVGDDFIIDIYKLERKN